MNPKGTNHHVDPHHRGRRQLATSTWIFKRGKSSCQIPVSVTSSANLSIIARKGICHEAFLESSSRAPRSLHARYSLLFCLGLGLCGSGCSLAGCDLLRIFWDQLC